MMMKIVQGVGRECVCEREGGKEGERERVERWKEIGREEEREEGAEGRR